jgi:Ca2+-binding EF-hand superfamily protein
VLALYDKDKNGKLSRAEIGLDKPLFDRLDTDHDGQLDGKEFAGFFQRDADLELVGRIGQMEAKDAKIANFFRNIGLTGKPLRAEVFNPAKRAMPLAAKVHRHDPAALGFGLGDAHIDLSVSDQTFAQFSNLKNFYTQQFKQADADKKGVIDLKKAKTAQFLEQIFPLADRDGDGKLTEKELNAYLDMQVEGSGARMQLTITDEGRNLFDLLDENADSRLSVRELRSAWSRIKPLAKSAEGLARRDVPRRLQVSVGQNQGRRFRTPIVSGRGTAKVVQKSTPLWFSKMDRNHDGDLSVREFLGSEEDFRKLDADGDGLISVEEARQFEAKLAKSKEAKR